MKGPKTLAKYTENEGTQTLAKYSENEGTQKYIGRNIGYGRHRILSTSFYILIIFFELVFQFNYIF